MDQADALARRKHQARGDGAAGGTRSMQALREVEREKALGEVTLRWGDTRRVLG